MLPLSKDSKNKLKENVLIAYQKIGTFRSFQEFVALFDTMFFLDIEINNTIYKQIVNNPISKLKKITDISFTLGQYGILCSKICLKKWYSKIYTAISNIYSQYEKNDEVDIFALNWKIQFQYHYKSKVNSRRKEGIIYKIDIEKSRKKLVSYFEKKKDHFDKLETNYLAVLFEATCHLFKILNNGKLGHGVELNDLKNILFYTFMYLLQNRLDKDVYFKFTNNQSRLDITCHVLSGIFLMF